MRALTVLKPGLLTTVQDCGRIGLAYLGVPRSGAADLPALERANRLVGNAPDAAGLESTLTGPVLRAESDLLVAVTGAPVPVRVGGSDVAFGTAVRVPAGAELALGTARSGLRSYLAVAGGLAVPAVLGSRATDTLSGLGPSPLRRGETVPVGDPPSTVPDPAASGRAATPQASGSDGGIVTLRVHPGPRVDWFTPEAVRTLLTADYQASPTSNRVGVRLTGPVLARTVEAELPSEGVVLGAVQVPAGGEPLVFLADHPTTGGYPVIAVVDPADVPLAAQARPGTPVRFRASEGAPGWT